MLVSNQECPIHKVSQYVSFIQPSPISQQQQIESLDDHGSFDCPHAWRPIGWLTAFTISIVSLVPEVGWMGAFCIRVYLCLQPGMLHGAMCLQTSMLESFVYKGFLDVNTFERRYQGLARPSAVTICITVLYYRRSILHTPKQAKVLVGNARP